MSHPLLSYNKRSEIRSFEYHKLTTLSAMAHPVSFVSEQPYTVLGASISEEVNYSEVLKGLTQSFEYTTCCFSSFEHTHADALAVNPRNCVSDLWAPWLLMGGSNDQRDSRVIYSRLEIELLRAYFLIETGSQELATKSLLGDQTKWMFAYGKNLITSDYPFDSAEEQGGIQIIHLHELEYCEKWGITVHGADSLANIGASFLIEPDVEGNNVKVFPIPYDKDGSSSLFVSCHNINSAFKVLEDVGLAAWVRQYLRHIVAIGSFSNFNGRYSVSAPDMPSLAFIDARGSVDDVIESIIHEASHQQLYLLELGEPLVSEHVLAPSPFRSTLRSLRRVLAGAHAFANTIYALDICSCSLNSRRSRARVDLLRAKLSSALAILENSTILSKASLGIVNKIRDVHSIDRRISWVLSAQPLSQSTGEPLQDHPQPADPWAWIVDKGSWFRKFSNQTNSWHSSLLDAKYSEEWMWLLKQAAEDRQSWLFHPCMSPIISGDHSLKAEVAMFAWSALHTQQMDSFSFSLEPGLLIWAPCGGYRLEKTFYSGTELRNMYCIQSILAPFSIDACSFFFEQTPVRADASQGFSDDIRRLANALTLIKQLSGSLFEWVISVTKVISVPISSMRASMGSSSNDLMPGCIYTEIFCDPHSIVELIVHESAHLHLFLAEANEHLVNPSHLQLYWSPLRKDPRPLRGILLAFHALSYMGAYYKLLIESSSHISSIDSIHKLTTAQASLSMNTLERSFDGLTTAGIDFFYKTKEVFSYAVS